MPSPPLRAFVPRADPSETTVAFNASRSTRLEGVDRLEGGSALLGSDPILKDLRTTQRVALTAVAGSLHFWGNLWWLGVGRWERSSTRRAQPPGKITPAGLAAQESFPGGHRHLQATVGGGASGRTTGARSEV